MSVGRRAVSRALIALGLAGLVFGAVAASQLRRVTPFGPPLLGASSLDVDATGRVYVGTRGDRIHVYAPEGKFLRGWALESDAGAVRVRVAAPDRIEAATERSGRRHVFDRDGQRVESRADAGAFARFGPARDRAAEGPGGARYEIVDDGALWRTAPVPPQVLAPPLRRPLRWIAEAPLPALTALLIASVGAILTGVLLSARRRAVSPLATR